MNLFSKIKRKLNTKMEPENYTCKLDSLYRKELGWGLYGFDTVHSYAFSELKAYEKEREWVKSFLSLASFIDLKKTEVKKVLAFNNSDHSHEKLNPICLNLALANHDKNTTDLKELLVDESYITNTVFVGWAYLLCIVLKEDIARFRVLAITPSSYAEGLRFTNQRKKFIKKFLEETEGIEMLYLGAEWCEVPLSGNDGDVQLPHHHPIPLSMWSVTKFIQYLSYSGYKVNLPGIITSFNNHGEKVQFNGKITKSVYNNDDHEWTVT